MWQFLPCHSNTILLLLLQSPSSPLLQQLSCHAWFLFYFMKFAAILWPVLKCYRILWTFTKYYEICGNFVTDDRWRRQIKAPPDDCWLNMCAAASIHNLAFGHQCGFFLLIEIVMESVDWMKLKIGWYHQICSKKSQVFASCLNYWCAPNPILPFGFSLILYMIHHSRPTPCHPRNLHQFSSKSDGSSFMLSVQNLKWVMFDKWYKFNLFCCSSCQ